MLRDDDEMSVEPEMSEKPVLEVSEPELPLDTHTNDTDTHTNAPSPYSNEGFTHSNPTFAVHHDEIGAIDPNNPLGLPQEEIEDIEDRIEKAAENALASPPLQPEIQVDGEGNPLFLFDKNGTPISNGRRGKKPHTNPALIRERREYATKLKAQSIPMAGILTRVNSLSIEKGWGTIGLSQLKQDIALTQVESDDVSFKESQKINEGSKLSLLAQMEEDIFILSKMVQEARLTKKNKTEEVDTGKVDKNGQPIMEKVKSRVLSPGQIIMALGQKLEYQKAMAKLQGWEPTNATINNNLNVHNNSVDAKFFESASDSVRSLGGEADKRFTRILSDSQKVLQELWRLQLASGVVDEAGRVVEAQGND